MGSLVIDASIRQRKPREPNSREGINSGCLQIALPCEQAFYLGEPSFSICVATSFPTLSQLKRRVNSI